MTKKKLIIILIVLFIVILIITSFFDTSLDGKTIAFLGDSLMSGYGNDDKSFDYYFSSVLTKSDFINVSTGRFNNFNFNR